jgi:hypothetical protein
VKTEKKKKKKWTGRPWRRANGQLRERLELLQVDPLFILIFLFFKARREREEGAPSELYMTIMIKS